MEITPGKPATELASLMSASLQNARFKERKLREAESDVHSDVVYYSPVVRIDKDTQTAVLQYRNSETGEVSREYPKKAALDIYSETQANTSPVSVPEETEVAEPESHVDVDS